MTNWSNYLMGRKNKNIIEYSCCKSVVISNI